MRIQIALLALALGYCSLAQAQYEYQVPQQTLNQRFEHFIEPTAELQLEQQQGKARRTSCTTKANCCE